VYANNFQATKIIFLKLYIFYATKKINIFNFVVLKIIYKTWVHNFIVCLIIKITGQSINCGINQGGLKEENNFNESNDITFKADTEHDNNIM